MGQLKSHDTRNLDQYRVLHLEKPEYGNSSPSLINLITFIIKHSQLDLKKTDRILDFGCGKSNAILKIAQKLKVCGVKYDPALPQYSDVPSGMFKFVINTDVLEHIDQVELPSILQDIRTYSSSVIFNISTRAAKTILPNGENAHATVKPADWWLEKIREYYPNSQIVLNTNNEVTIVTFKVSSNVINKLDIIKRGGIRAKLIMLFS